MHKIVYLQTDEKIVELFREEFEANDIEMLVVKSGEEALETIKKEKVLLLLIDINIPDMRFRELVERIRRISPQVIVNVCIDVLDPLLITKLSNRHHVHKIYAAPWEVYSIVEEVKESIEIAIINEQVNIKEESINAEMEELKATLESLKKTLKKQQHSYSKLSTLTECFTKAMEEDETFDIERGEKMAFATDVYKTILKMQTTGSFDIDKFEEDINRDLKEISAISKGFRNEGISSCLFGGQSKAYAQNIRFSIFLIARLHAQFNDSFSISASSHYITTKLAEFVVTIKGNNKLSSSDADSFAKYSEYAEKIIEILSSEFRKSEKDDEISYYMTFPVERE